MKKITCLSLITSLSFIFCFLDYRNVGLSSSSVTFLHKKRDADRLDYLFRDLIIYDSGGYTLLGNKAISFDSFIKPCFEWDFLYLWHAFSLANLKKYSAWQTWQKYEHLFNKGDIQIWSEPSPGLKNSELIVIASKKQIARMIQENQDEFAILHDKEDFRVIFKESLQHEELLGILLGYGRTNAKLFSEHKVDILKSPFSSEINQLFKRKKAALHFAFGWPSIEMENVLMYPAFAADPDSNETKLLKLDYLSTRQKILEYYEGKNFLEATLQLLK